MSVYDVRCLACGGFGVREVDALGNVSIRCDEYDACVRSAVRRAHDSVRDNAYDIDSLSEYQRQQVIFAARVGKVKDVNWSARMVAWLGQRAAKRAQTAAGLRGASAA
jgi:hypothetical protein